MGPNKWNTPLRDIPMPSLKGLEQTRSCNHQCQVLQRQARNVHRYAEEARDIELRRVLQRAEAHEHRIRALPNLIQVFL